MTTHDSTHPPPAAAIQRQLQALVAETWDALIERDPYMALIGGRSIERFPTGNLAEAQAVVDRARDCLARLELLDVSQLERTDRLTAAHLRFCLEEEAAEVQRWWTSFGITPYTGGGLSLYPTVIFPGIDVSASGGLQRYMTLAHEFATSVECLKDRVLAQAQRGWRLPKPALANTRHFLQAAAASATATIRIDDEQQASADARAAIASLVNGRLAAAFDALLDAIGPAYEDAAPDHIGLCHQPGGPEAYQRFIRSHVSEACDPDEVHAVGLAEVQRLAAEMAHVRIEGFGFRGDEASFHERLRQDLRAKVPSAAALEERYRRHLDRMAPVFARLFRKAPDTRATLKRLAPALEQGMAFGYYEPPRGAGEDGCYYFSANGVPDRLQINAAPLIFHELMPGHHVHIARQLENQALPPLRRVALLFAGFNEGWAEYAAGLADEQGLYDDPYDHYGWLAHQRFIAQRLVVDTGLNALGWSMEQAVAYMSANTLEAPQQVRSEVLRYATDMPGQALCYRLGFLKFRRLRARAQRSLGDRFDIADFHEAILEQGALPLSVLDDSLLEWEAAQILNRILPAPAEASP